MTLGTALALVGLLIGCGPVDRLEPERRSSPIINGTQTSNWPAVGALGIEAAYMGYFAQFCSGTLIDDEWVLTAAHCLDQQDLAAYMVSFFVGVNSNNPGSGTLYAADAFHIHPSWNPQNGANDIGLLHLQDPALPVATIPYNTANLGPYDGDPITMVGYGLEDAYDQNSGGIKRYGTSVIDWVDFYVFGYDYSVDNQLTCFGDSGGATLMDMSGTEKLIGVNSAVGDDYCSSYGVSVRVDIYDTWIANTMSGGGPVECDITGGDCGNDVCYPVEVDANQCLPSDGLGLGQQCNADSSTWVDALPCGDGLICLQVSDNVNDGRCFAFCLQDNDCGATEYCEIPIFQDVDDIGVCLCIDDDDDGYCQTDDCNDHSASVHPGAAETCGNGVDDDCDGQTDEGCTCTDDDDDGYCQADDCNDHDAAVHPGAAETCGNGVDDDCDGQTDEGCGCTDNDNDGYCQGDDCNDYAASIHPGAAERCDNGVDDDCDGQTDEGCDCTDIDGDGYCQGVDCNDHDSSIHPDAAERCDDGVDDDCDGQTDEGCGTADCQVDADCDDGNPCILDVCVSDTCFHEEVPNDRYMACGPNNICLNGECVELPPDSKSGCGTVAGAPAGSGLFLLLLTLVFGACLRTRRWW